MSNNPQNKDTSVQDMLKQAGSRKRRSSGWRWLFFLLLLGGGAYGGWYYYLQQQQVAATPEYVTAPVSTGNLSTRVTATGNLQPLNQVDIGTELSGTVEAVLVDENAEVKKGQELARLNTDQLEDAITKAKAALITAKSKVSQAEAQIIQTQAKVRQAVASVQQAIAGAEQSVASAAQSSTNVIQSELNVRQSNASVQQGLASIEQANAQVAQAKATTLDARLELNRLQQLYKESAGKLPAKIDLDTAVTTWKKAVAAEAAAQAALKTATAGLTSTKTGVEVAKNSVNASKTGATAAQFSTTAARANIDGVKAAVEAAKADDVSARANLEAANAGVMDAQADLSSAETNLTKATIRAPIDGVILTRTVEPGQTVASSLSAPTLFTLAEDLAKMELLVGVDEADVAQVKEGQKAEFTVDAWPGRKFPASITRLSLGSTLLDNVVTYQGLLTVDNKDMSLRPGMTATASIVTNERQNVLLVPSAALRFSPPQPDGAANSANGAGAAPAAAGGSFLSKLMPQPPMRRRPQSGKRQGSGQDDGGGQGGQRDPSHGRVWVLEEGQPKRIRVTVGISDGKSTEVSSDELKDGMQVITDSKSVKS